MPIFKDELIVACPNRMTCVHHRTCHHSDPHLLSKCIELGQPMIVAGKDNFQKCKPCEERGHVTTEYGTPKENFKDNIKLLRATVNRKREFFNGTLE